jgi:serine/threonine-protein kinase
LDVLGSARLVETSGTRARTLSSVLSQPKRLALLAYLAVAHPPGLHRRDKLLALFWPDLDEAHARNALSSSLTALRKALGDGVIQTRGRHEVGVDPTQIRTDVEDLERALEAGELESALRHYRGHFLDGFHLPGCHGFQEWVSLERTRLMEAAAETAWDLAHQQIAAGDPTAAERTAQRALHWLPTDECQVRSFVQALAEGGDRAAAIRFFDRFSDLLRAELDLAPSAETLAVVSEVRADRETGVVARERQLLPPPPPRSTHPRSQPKGRVPSSWKRVATATAGGTLALLLLLLRPTVAPQLQEGVPRRVHWTILAQVEGSAPEELRSVVGDLLSLDIDRSGVFLTLPRGQLERGLAEAMQPPSAPLTVLLARELADRGRLGTVFAPTLDQVGEGLVLSLRVVRADSDSVMAAASFLALEAEDLFEGSRHVVGTVSASLAEWGGSARGQWRWPVVTDSWEAFEELQEAKRANARGDFRVAIASAREALELDPDFAGAWSMLRIAYANLGLRDSAKIAAEEALLRPDRLSEEQRLLLQAYLANDPGATVELLRRKYHATGVADNSFALALYRVGLWEEAAAVHEEMERQSPFPLPPLLHHNRALILMLLGRTDEAKRVIEGAAGTPWHASMKARIAVREGDWASAEELASGIIDSPGHPLAFRSVAHLSLASAHAARGRIEAAYATLRAGADEAARAGSGLHRQMHRSALLLSWTSGVDPDPWSLASLEADTSVAGAQVLGLWAVHRGDTARARSILGGRPEPGPGGRGRPSHPWTLLEALLAMEGEEWETAAGLLQPVSGGRASREDSFNVLRHWAFAEAEQEAGNLESAAQRFADIARGENFGYFDYVGFGLIRPFAHRRAALILDGTGRPEEAQEHWRMVPADLGGPASEAVAPIPPNTP